MEREIKAPPTGQRLAKSRNFKFWETESHATVLNPHWHGDAARPRQRRHRSNGAQAIPQGAHARRLWPHSFLRLALSLRGEAQSRVRPEFPALQGRFGPAGAR